MDTEWKSWSFANPDFRRFWKNLNSHQEARRQGWDISDRIRCYRYKMSPLKNRNVPVPMSALLWCILTEARKHPQHKADLNRRAFGQEDRIFFPWFQCEPYPLAAKSIWSGAIRRIRLGLPVVLAHTPTHTNTDIRRWLTHFPAISSPFASSNMWLILSQPCGLTPVSFIHHHVSLGNRK